MPALYSTPKAAPNTPRGTGVEGSLNQINTALDELEAQVETLMQELSSVCRPYGQTCSETESDRAIQSPLKDALDSNILRIKRIRDAVASIRSNLDL